MATFRQRCGQVVESTLLGTGMSAGLWGDIILGGSDFTRGAAIALGGIATAYAGLVNFDKFFIEASTEEPDASDILMGVSPTGNAAACHNTQVFYGPDSNH
jgi:hypothetical protein